MPQPGRIHASRVPTEETAEIGFRGGRAAGARLPDLSEDGITALPNGVGGGELAITERRLALGDGIEGPLGVRVERFEIGVEGSGSAGDGLVEGVQVVGERLPEEDTVGEERLLRFQVVEVAVDSIAGEGLGRHGVGRGEVKSEDVRVVKRERERERKHSFIARAHCYLWAQM